MFFADWVGTFTVWTVKKLSFSRITFTMTAIAFQKRLQSSLYLVKLRLISIEHNISGFLKPRIKIKFFLYFCVIWFRHFVWMNSIEYFVRLYSTRSWKKDDSSEWRYELSAKLNNKRQKKKKTWKNSRKFGKIPDIVGFVGIFHSFVERSSSLSFASLNKRSRKFQTGTRHMDKIVMRVGTRLVPEIWLIKLSELVPSGYQILIWVSGSRLLDCPHA